MRRRFLLFVAMATVVGATAAVVVGQQTLAAGSAPAAGPLQLSNDGSHWGATIREPLFDPRVRWVPGDVRTSTFFVRGGLEDLGDLTVDVVRGQQNALRDTGSLAVETRADGGAWTGIDSGETRRLVTAAEVEGGRPVPVDMRVRLDPRATDQTMVASADLDLLITVYPVVGVATDGRIGAPPSTGFPAAPWLPLLCLLVLGAGAFAATSRTRHRSPAPPHVRTPA